MKKRLFLLSLLIFLMPLVYAERVEEIFNDWVYDEGNFSADGKQFYSTVSAQTDIVGITYADEKVLVRLSECKYLINKFKVCFREKELWYESKLERKFYKAKIEIYKFLASVNLTRSVKDTNLLIGGQTEIISIFQSSGSLPATNVEFTEEIPKNFTIVGFPNCVWAGNKVKWTGDMKIGRTVQCSYNIKALAKASYASKASVRYFDGEKSVIVYSTPITIEVPDYSLNVSFNFTNNSIHVGNMVVIEMNLKNDDKEQPLTVSSLSIDLPAGLKYVSSSYGMKQSGDKVVYSGVISADTSRRLIMELRPEMTGEFPIEGSAVFEIAGLLEQMDIGAPRKLRAHIVNLSIIRHMPSIVKSGDRFRINVSVRNPSRFVYKNIDTGMKSDMPGIKNKSLGLIGRMNSGDSKNLLYSEFVAPDVNADTSYDVSVYSSFMTPYSEYVQIKEQGKIIVKGTGITLETPVIVEAPPPAEAEAGAEPEEKKPLPAMPDEVVGVRTKLIIFVVILVFVLIDLLLMGAIVKKIRSGKEGGSRKKEMEKAASQDKEEEVSETPIPTEDKEVSKEKIP